MMSHKFLIFLVFLFVVATLICVIIEGSQFGSDEENVMNYLAVIKTETLLGRFEVPMLNIDFFTKGMPMLIMWDYSFLEGGYGYFKWILLYPLTAGAAFGFAMILKDVWDSFH